MKIIIYIFGFFSSIKLDYNVELSFFGEVFNAAINEASVPPCANDVALFQLVRGTLAEPSVNENQPA